MRPHTNQTRILYLMLQQHMRLQHTNWRRWIHNLWASVVDPCCYCWRKYSPCSGRYWFNDFSFRGVPTGFYHISCWLCVTREKTHRVRLLNSRLAKGVFPVWFPRTGAPLLVYLLHKVRQRCNVLCLMLEVLPGFRPHRIHAHLMGRLLISTY